MAKLLHSASAAGARLGFLRARELFLFQRLALFLLILALGLLVFTVFSHYFPLLGQKWDLPGRVALGALLLAAAWAARRSARWHDYWLLPFAYFTALAAISVDYYLGLGRWIMPALGVEAESPAGWAIDKLESSLLGILVAILLTRLAGQSLGSIFIRRGNLPLGLGVGLLAMAVMIAAVIPTANAFFKGQDLSWSRILPWAPYILVMVLANASNEELLFRGVLIGRMEPFLGRFAINLATTIPFVSAHAFTSYSLDNFVFLFLQTLPFALAWCWLMQRSRSLWGSILFHAACDIPIFVGMFSNQF